MQLPHKEYSLYLVLVLYNISRYTGRPAGTAGSYSVWQFILWHQFETKGVCYEYSTCSCGINDIALVGLLLEISAMGRVIVLL